MILQKLQSLEEASWRNPEKQKMQEAPHLKKASQGLACQRPDLGGLLPGAQSQPPSVPVMGGKAESVGEPNVYCTPVIPRKKTFNAPCGYAPSVLRPQAQ